MVSVSVTTQVKGEIEAIQKRFEKHLSKDEINRLTAGAMNEAAKRAISNKEAGVKAEIMKQFNVGKKHLNNVAVVAPRARGNFLQAGIKIRWATIPLIAFKPIQVDEGVRAEIQKGKFTIIPHAFIATPGELRSRHTRGSKKGQVKIGAGTHVFGRGEYKKGGRFVPSKARSVKGGGGYKGTSALSRMHTVSPFAMALNEQVAARLSAMMKKEVLRGTQGALDDAVKKMKK